MCVFRLLPVILSVYSYLKLPILKPAVLIMSVQTHHGPVTGRTGEVSHPLYCICLYSMKNQKKSLPVWLSWMWCLKVIIIIFFFQAVNRCPLKYSSTEFELCFGVSIKDRGTGTFQTTPAPQRPPSWHQLLPNTQNIRVCFFTCSISGSFSFPLTLFSSF